jgi:hypothetical protein
MRVFHGRHHSWRLVDKPRALLRVQWETYAVDQNRRGSWVDSVSEGSLVSVDRHPASFDQDVSLSTRRDAGPCDQFVESFDDDSGRIGISSVSTISAGGTWSASGGRSEIEATPIFSRKSAVVP